MEHIIPQFESAYPKIKVDVQTIPWNSAHEKLLTAFAGRSTPDICQLGNTWIAEFNAMDALLSLDSLIAHSKIVDKDAFFKGIWKTNIIADRVFGIPWYVDTRLLFYRKDILQRVGYNHPPKTWSEWLDVSRGINQKLYRNQKKYPVFFSLIYNDWQVPVILIMENKGRLLKNNNCYGAFDDPATVEALKFYLTFFDEGLAPRNMTEVSNVYQGFSTGFFTMFITGPWDVNEMRRRAREIKDQWSTAPMPRKKNNNSVAGGSSLIIFKDSKHPKEAWKFIEFLSKAKTQLEFFKHTKDLPAVREAWSAPALKNDQEIQVFYEQLSSVETTPKVAEWEQIAVKIQEHMELVVYGKATLNEAIQSLNKDVNKILEKRRWLLANDLLDIINQQ